MSRKGTTISLGENKERNIIMWKMYSGLPLHPELYKIEKLMDKRVIVYACGASPPNEAII